LSFHTEPPKPGTYTDSPTIAAWNTGSQPPSSPLASGSGFQSLAKVHLVTSAPPSQWSRLSFQTGFKQLSVAQGYGPPPMPGGLQFT
jgi:hypothetical protein